MKKETVIAIVFGIALGGVVALFILFKGKDFEFNTTKVISPEVADQKAAGQPINVSIQPLTVITPADNSIIDVNTVTIVGKVEKGSLLVIQSPIKDLVFEAEENDFKVEMPLALGENAIKIVAYPRDKTLRSQEKDLKIYFLDSEL